MLGSTCSARMLSLLTGCSRPVAYTAANDHFDRMKIRFSLYIAACWLMTTTTSWAQATAPQIPLAAGSVESVTQVVIQAHTCGFRRLRIEFRQEALPPNAPVGPANLFLDDIPAEDADRCLDSWITANGKRLRLLPRWHGDTFDQTLHDLRAEGLSQNLAREL